MPADPPSRHPRLKQPLGKTQLALSVAIVKSARVLLVGGSMASLSLLIGCNGDSYMDPSKTGLFSTTATTMPVLSRLDVIERPTRSNAEVGPPVPQELVATVKPEYRIAPGDLIRVTVLDIGFTGAAEEVDRSVGPDGLVMLPELGGVRAAGATLEEFEGAIRQEILNKELLRPGAMPRVAVSLLQGRGMVFTIDGQVGQPNEYTLTSGDFRIRQALATAGGTSPTTKRILISRAQDYDAGLGTDEEPSAGGGTSTRSTNPAAGPSGSSTRTTTPGLPATGTQPSPAPPSTPTRPTPSIDDLIKGLEASEGAGGPTGAGAADPSRSGSTTPLDVPRGNSTPLPPPIEPEAPSLPGFGPSEPDLPSHSPAGAPSAPGALGSTRTPDPAEFAYGPGAPSRPGQDATGLQAPSAADPAVTNQTGDAFRYPTVSLDNEPLDFKFDPQTQRWLRVANTSGVAGAAPTKGAYDPQDLDTGKNDVFGVPTRVIEVDYAKLISGDPNQNVVVRPNDYIYVEPPPIGVVYIGGEVLRPGVFQLPQSGEFTLSRAITAAGELGAIAIPEKVDLTRRIEGGREATIRVNLAAIRRRTEPDIVLKPDDHLIVGTDFWATPLAVIRNGFRATYGFGFVIDRNWGNDIFGAPPVNET
ncbi:MAG: polysaccharide biosynthesis/export family protein [Planctomycetota bacterium]|nr:polysaccharide biosynthesis/export family protein [Planctomycetota bacterium]MDA1105850.1 polysaccharide biosynthesis/export family protein [Planctomycetota bacterium]